MQHNRYTAAAGIVTIPAAVLFEEAACICARHMWCTYYLIPISTYRPRVDIARGITMDQNALFIRKAKIDRTIEALGKNGITGHFAGSEDELHKIIKEIVPAGATVATGGSMTLAETGTEDMLMRDFSYISYDHGSLEDSRRIFSADAFLCSANAVTENGEIYNVDGNGNRVAAMLWGPSLVIIVAGANKIVPDLDAAIERNCQISAPMNAKRLKRDTPCAKVGHCMDCRSPDRICNDYVLIRRQRIKGRFHVIFMNTDLGY
jgi:hypothetical protein